MSAKSLKAASKHAGVIEEDDDPDAEARVFQGQGAASVSGDQVSTYNTPTEDEAATVRERTEKGEAGERRAHIEAGQAGQTVEAISSAGESTADAQRAAPDGATQDSPVIDMHARPIGEAPAAPGVDGAGDDQATAWVTADQQTAIAAGADGVEAAFSQSRDEGGPDEALSETANDDAETEAAADDEDTDFNSEYAAQVKALIPQAIPRHQQQPMGPVGAAVSLPFVRLSRYRRARAVKSYMRAAQSMGEVERHVHRITKDSQVADFGERLRRARNGSGDPKAVRREFNAMLDKPENAHLKRHFEALDGAIRNAGADSKKALRHGSASLVGGDPQPFGAVHEAFTNDMKDQLKDVAALKPDEGYIERITEMAREIATMVQMLFAKLGMALPRQAGASQPSQVPG